MCSTHVFGPLVLVLSPFDPPSFFFSTQFALRFVCQSVGEHPVALCRTVREVIFGGYIGTWTHRYMGTWGYVCMGAWVSGYMVMVLVLWYMGIGRWVDGSMGTCG